MGKEYKYKSPITVYDQLENMTTLDDIAELARKAANAVDDAIVCSVQHEVGIKVDRNELLKALMYDRKQYEKGYDDGYRDGTAAVEPVRHGRWKHEEKQIGIQKYQVEHHIVCSECQSRYKIVYVYMLLGEGKLFIRCPYCGAKMDGKENEE